MTPAPTSAHEHHNNNYSAFPTEERPQDSYAQYATEEQAVMSPLTDPVSSPMLAQKTQPLHQAQHQQSQEQQSHHYQYPPQVELSTTEQAYSIEGSSANYEQSYNNYPSSVEPDKVFQLHNRVNICSLCFTVC
jgi:hypothetical protein